MPRGRPCRMQPAGRAAPIRAEPPVFFCSFCVWLRTCTKLADLTPRLLSYRVQSRKFPGHFGRERDVLPVCVSPAQPCLAVEGRPGPGGRWASMLTRASSPLSRPRAARQTSDGGLCASGAPPCSVRILTSRTSRIPLIITWVVVAQRRSGLEPLVPPCCAVGGTAYLHGARGAARAVRLPLALTRGPGAGACWRPGRSSARMRVLCASSRGGGRRRPGRSFSAPLLLPGQSAGHAQAVGAAPSHLRPGRAQAASVAPSSPRSCPGGATEHRRGTLNPHKATRAAGDEEAPPPPPSSTPRRTPHTALEERSILRSPRA